MAKFGSVPFAGLLQRSLAIKQNAEFCGGWVKMQVEFEAVCAPEVHDILERCRKPLVDVNALDRLSISCFIPKI